MKIKKSYIAKVQYIEKTDQLDDLARAAGEFYSKTVYSHWRTWRKKGIWLSEYTMARWHKSQPRLHAHTCDAITAKFHDNLKSWKSLKKNDPKAKPPTKGRRFFVLIYKEKQIRIKSGNLHLSNGRKYEPLIIHNWKHDIPQQIQIVYDKNKQKYKLCCLYLINNPDILENGDIAGIDLGEIHPAVIHTQNDCLIANGKILRSKRRYQNKNQATLQRRLDRKKKGSRRWKKLLNLKRRQQQKIQNQINDVLHQQSRRIIRTLHERGVRKMYIGKLTGIRKNINFGKKTNQKLHQWSFSKFKDHLIYKGKSYGIDSELISEAYTSQTCPSCSKINKTTSRNYTCKCGFAGHRDAVGAFNIRRNAVKSIGGNTTVVGEMASPTGIQYTNHRVARPLNNEKISINLHISDSTI